MGDKIRVLIVDDSAFLRLALEAILKSDPALEVIGFAKNGKEGLEMTLALKPDVITMDVKMPVMSGLEATEAIMTECPTPIIIVSSLDKTVAVKALSVGAMDLVAITSDLKSMAVDLISRVKAASRVQPLRRMKFAPAPAKIPSFEQVKGLSKVVAVGISTGGPQALREVLARLPARFPAGLLVVQHMSRGFIEGLAEWLNLSSSLRITVAGAGERLADGMVLLAPDDRHMKIDRDGVIELAENTNKALYHVPSIDVMMQSVAESFGDRAIGVIMTGMGSDGVAGIRAIKAARGITVAQDEQTSVIYGMNKVAVDAQLIDYVVPLPGISAQLQKLV